MYVSKYIYIYIYIYIHIVLFKAQNLPYYIVALKKVPFFSVKSRHLFTVQTPTCPPGKLSVVKSTIALELRKRPLLTKYKYSNTPNKKYILILSLSEHVWC